MKICFVSKEVTGIRGGGIGTYVAEAGKALTARGHEVWLLIQDPGPDRAHLLDALPGFHRVVPVGAGVPPEQRVKLFSGNPHYEHSYLVHQTLQALDQGFDYIEFADFQAEGYVALREHDQFGAHEPSVLAVTIHSPTWECFEWNKQAHRASMDVRDICSLEEEALRIAPFLNGPSRNYSGEVVRRLGLPQEVAVIPYPMEQAPQVPEPPAPRERLEDLKFLYYGRIEQRKGVEELVEAFARLPELSIDLIGGDVDYSPYGESSIEWVGRHATDNVRLLEPMPRPELLERIARADVCILPSLLENYPNTCIEAMSAARVVLGSRHGGMAEMIEHGVSGFHVDGRSADEIVRVIREDLAAALPRLDEIGRAAAQRMRALSSPDAYVAAIEARVEQGRRRKRGRPAITPGSSTVSIVIPFREDRDCVDAAVDAALAQSHGVAEVLLVDDGSTLPDAAAILARQAAKDARVAVLARSVGASQSARQLGIERATGDYVLLLDSGHVADPELARIAVGVLESKPEAAFVVPHVRFVHPQTLESYGCSNPLPFDPRTALLDNRFGSGCTLLRRKVLEDHGLRLDALLLGREEWGLWLDLHRLGLRGEYVQRTLCDYRMRTDSRMKGPEGSRYPAVLGLLVERHLKQLDGESREILTTMLQTVGMSVLRVMQGGKDDVSPPTPPPLRHKLVDEVSRVSRKIPGLNALLRAGLGGVQWLARGGRAPGPPSGS